MEPPFREPIKQWEPVQYITVLPALYMVIAHKVDIDQDPRAQVSDTEYDAILQMVTACVCPETCK